MTAHPPLERFLTLSEAASRMKVAADELRTMIQAGRIKGAILPNGEIGVSESAIPTPPTPKEQLPEYKKHSHLKGVPIWLSEAGRKYQIPLMTVSRWVSAGYIKSLGMDGNRILIDEADIAYCAEIYRQRKGQGKWLFNPDGTPYRKMTQESII
ncbi:MAG TPA: hypothetical protein PK530_20080 [Anaerolineales bacterium]|nr:hypothetical protein [Anaerolineales bacterium]